MPNQTVSLTPDEQASPATLTTQPPIVVDPILHQTSPQDVSTPSTSLSLSLASTPSDAPHQSLPFGAQVPLGRPSLGTASPLVLSTLPAERLAQRRMIKRRCSLLKSSTEGSGVEDSYGGAVLETPIDQVGLLLDNLMKRHEGFARPQSNFIRSEDSGARVEELAHLFAERDAFTSELLDVMKMMASQMKEWQARGGEGDGEGDVWAFSNVRTGTSSRKKMKVDRTPFEQKVNNLVKVRTHAVIQHVLDFRPSGKETVPSIGDLRKNDDGTMSEELLDIPDWSQGAMSRANERWMAMIKKKTCEDTEVKSQELCSALNDGQQKEIVLQAITSSATTYFEHLRRRWRDENDMERLERREAVSRQSKRDQRVRLLHKRLIKEATLEQVNIWIEKAAMRLDLPRVEITEDDIPQDALSDLESDAEDVSHLEKMRYAKEAGLEKVTSKWMSRRKAWTSGEFEALKDLVKVVANSREVRSATAPKKAPATSQYRGPLTSHRLMTMKNVQDWMVDPIMLLDDLTTCKKNHEPPFTPTTIQTLKSLLKTALEICSKGGGDNSEPETQY